MMFRQATGRAETAGLSDRRALHAVAGLHEHRAHVGELHELLGGATDVGTKIERRGRAPAGR